MLILCLHSLLDKLLSDPSAGKRVMSFKLTCLQTAVISVQRIFRRYAMDPMRREGRRQRAAKLLLSFFRELYRRREFVKRAEYLCQQCEHLSPSIFAGLAHHEFL